MYAVEENHNRQLQVDISGLKHALQQAQTHEKERCLEVLMQSHTRFNRLMEISSSEAFHLGWEQAMTEPSALFFSGPDEYDALNKIEGRNYDLDFYVRKENLGVTFAEEMEEETEPHGANSQVLGSEFSDRWAKDQLQVKSKFISSSGASDLEGFLEFPSISTTQTTHTGFDDTVTIHFNPPMLQSPEVQSLSFFDRSNASQFPPAMLRPSTQAIEAPNRGQGPELQNK